MKFSLSKLIYSLMMLLLVVSPAMADDLSDIQAKIADLQNKINAAKSQENTLSSQINNLNNQIQLTQYQIDAKQKEMDQKEAELTVLNSDITDVSGRITNLEANLDNQARIAAQRVRVSQALADAAPIETLFVTGDFQQASTNLTYTAYIQRKDKEVFDDMLALKSSLGVQKTTLQDKQAQVVQLRDDIKSDRDSLAASRNQLASQKYSLAQLLSVTKNNEATYQRLLQTAKAQEQSLLAFSRGRVGSGGSILSPIYYSDTWGTYYNQRDARWGNIYINYPSDCYGVLCQVWMVGCLLTDVAMMWTHFGYSNVTPASIAVDSSNFFSNTAQLNIPGPVPPGVSFANYNNPTLDQIRGFLRQGRVVIAGWSNDGGPVGPHWADHWVTLRGIDASGRPLMNDPWLNLQNVSMQDYYALNDNLYYTGKPGIIQIRVYWR